MSIRSIVSRTPISGRNAHSIHWNIEWPAQTSSRSAVARSNGRLSCAKSQILWMSTESRNRKRKYLVAKTESGIDSKRHGEGTGTEDIVVGAVVDLFIMFAAVRCIVRVPFEL
jgi:hypothetical protein